MRTIFFILFTFLFTSLIVAGGWTQKKGSGFYKISYRLLNGDNVYDDSGEKFSWAVEDHTIALYGEYGVTDNLTLTAAFLPYKSIKIDDQTAVQALNFNAKFPRYTEKSGIGDAEVGMRYRLKKFGKSVISTTLKLGIPTGETFEDGEIWLGSGEFNQALGLEFGHSFYPAPAYFTAGVSYRNRNKGFSDDFKYGISAGYSFTKSISVSGRFHGLNPLNNGDDNVRGGFAIYSNNQRYIAYGLNVSYKFTKGLGVSVGYESGGNGRNIISAPVISAGIYYSN